MSKCSMMSTSRWPLFCFFLAIVCTVAYGADSAQAAAPFSSDGPFRLIASDLQRTEILFNAGTSAEATDAQLDVTSNIPMASACLQIPLGACCTVRVSDAVYEDHAPAQSASPSAIGATIEELGFFRGRRLARIELRTTGLDPATHQLRALRSARLTISHNGADARATRAAHRRWSSPTFDNLAHHVTLNTAAFEQAIGATSATLKPTSTGGRAPCYLVISAAAFAGSQELQNLIQLRTNEGFTVVHVDTNTTGTSTQDIKNYIANAYFTWIEPPEFLLLVGDTSFLPCWIGTGGGTPPTDLYYASVDGDEIPDMLYGRLPAQTMTQLDNLCTKIIDMQGNAVREASFLVGEASWQQYEPLHDAMIGLYLGNQGWKSDRLYCHTYQATPQHVFDSFAYRRSLAVFTGMGQTDAWIDGPAFTQADVRALQNIVCPFVISLTGFTGDFSAFECFGETWLWGRHGATAFFGASSTAYTNFTANLEVWLFEGWWTYDHRRIGEMIAYAQLMVYMQAGPPPSMKQGHYEMYNLLGDPAMQVIDHATPIPPVPDIEVNGLDLDFAIPATTPITVSASLSPGDYLGVQQDWWLFVHRDFATTYWWQWPGKWTASSTPLRALDRGLIGFTSRVIGKATLPPGTWKLTFAIDDLNNAFEGTYEDHITITIY